MSYKRRAIYVICLFLFIATLTVIRSKLLSEGMIDAPASMDGRVTISESPDHTLTFITFMPSHLTISQRLLRLPVSGAFLVQHNRPMQNAVFHSGNAHINFLGDLLSVDFADSSQFVFTTRPKGAVAAGQAEVDYVMGLASYHARYADHSAFVGSRDWSKNSCTL